MDIISLGNHVIRKALCLSIVEMAVLCNIKKLSSNPRFGNICRQKKDEMSEWLDLSRATIFNAINALEAKGFVDKVEGGLVVTQFIHDLDAAQKEIALWIGKSTEEVEGAPGAVKSANSALLVTAKIKEMIESASLSYDDSLKFRLSKSLEQSLILRQNNLKNRLLKSKNWTPIYNKDISKKKEEEKYVAENSFVATATTHTPSDVEVSTPDNEPILTDENESKNTEVNQSAGEETFFPKSQTPLKKEGVAAAQSLSTLQSDEQRFERFKKLVRNYFRDHACEDEPKVFKGTWALTPKQYVKLIEDYNVNVFQERMEVIKKIILEIQNWKGSKSSANLTIRNWVNRDLRVSSHTMLPATKAEPKLPPPSAATSTFPQEIQFETFEEQTARKRREREEKLKQSNNDTRKEAP